MIAPVDAINMVDVRIEDDIIRRYMKTRRKTVQEKWTLLSSNVKIQTDVDNDFQPLYDGYLTYKILELHWEGAKPRSLDPYSPIFKAGFILKLL